MKPLLLILFLSLAGKTPSEIRIPYRQLCWADYQGKVPANAPTTAARSFIQTEMQTEEKGGKYHFLIVAYFLVDSSFVRTPTDQVLRHEQTHFKIACIEARKCNLVLAPMQGGDSLDWVSAQTLYDHCYDE